MTVLEELRRVERDVTSRLRELRPLVDEYRQLEEVASRLGLSTSSDSAPRSAARARPRRNGAAPARRVAARPGERRAQMLETVARRPNVTVRQVADELDVDPTSLYRVVRELVAGGEIVKDGATLRLPERR